MFEAPSLIPHSHVPTFAAPVDVRHGHGQAVDRRSAIPPIGHPPMHQPKPLPPRFYSGCHSVVLYQFEPSPFCHKVRAVLRYFGIPFHIVTVNPMTKSQIKWSSYRKVPILKIDDKQINDSDDIIEAIFATLLHIPYKIQDDPHTKWWSKWAAWAIIPTMMVNHCAKSSTVKESFGFAATAPWSKMERTATKHLMPLAAPLMLKKTFEPKTSPLWNEVTFTAFMAEYGLRGEPFLGGHQPCMADLVVYGYLYTYVVISSSRGSLLASPIGGWLIRMSHLVDLSTPYWGLHAPLG